MDQKRPDDRQPPFTPTQPSDVRPSHSSFHPSAFSASESVFGAGAHDGADAHPASASPATISAGTTIFFTVFFSPFSCLCSADLSAPAYSTTFPLRRRHQRRDHAPSDGR